mmetsp:Transcript_44473/g.100436  ORF Transcript_44473/g.100436 Transcript_44473/m.100436 type:complete len:279 (+) Transcript_44473:1587-2423(+)
MACWRCFCRVSPCPRRPRSSSSHASSSAMDCFSIRRSGTPSPSAAASGPAPAAGTVSARDAACKSLMTSATASWAASTAARAGSSTGSAFGAPTSWMNALMSWAVNRLPFAGTTGALIRGSVPLMPSVPADDAEDGAVLVTMVLATEAASLKASGFLSSRGDGADAGAGGGDVVGARSGARAPLGRGTGGGLFTGLRAGSWAGLAVSLAIKSRSALRMSSRTNGRASAAFSGPESLLLALYAMSSPLPRKASRECCRRRALRMEGNGKCVTVGQRARA